MTCDFGCGPVTTPTRVYQEHARLDIRDEILKLSEVDMKQVKHAVPRGVLDVYLLPPADHLPSISGNKDTFPDPRGIGEFDDI